MSFSVRDFVEESSTQLGFAQVLAEFYPNARFARDRWWSDKVTTEECDCVFVEPSSTTGTMNVYIGRSLGGGVIWQDGVYRMFPSLLAPPQRSTQSRPGELVRQELLKWAAIYC